MMGINEMMIVVFGMNVIIGIMHILSIWYFCFHDKKVLRENNNIYQGNIDALRGQQELLIKAVSTAQGQSQKLIKYNNSLLSELTEICSDEELEGIKKRVKKC